MKLRALSKSEFKASPGKFRAAIVIDHVIFQIGDDVLSLKEANLLCFTEISREHQFIFCR
ncbi:MAG: hypothetical protein A2909_01495 [Candidatus Tagabacteria bacterium RIFCSPLOWO2_01_FULL_39_11]|uniref:Uncharacterized protein n=1 Tax=Candidatus Tagabacteria bacterium RIFCSPLOWO2_01_FULL_39_11 TaxID=1802295 RepID=A0A1G2LTC7_9BACT|nr:MAG: hypothetical protein A2909_01495 [Candidatus Tagabacteria bacterium RIFCSPLOWO2_01_FULL_39_11]